MSERKNLSKINFLIDIIMFIILMAIAGLGFLIKFVILPGYKVNEVYGSNIELWFLGLDRHQWGSIHLYLSLFFLFLLFLHIVLHWKMIICLFRNMFSGVITRIVLSVLISLSVFFALIPFFIKPEINQFQGRNMRHKASIKNLESNYKAPEMLITEDKTKSNPENDTEAGLHQNLIYNDKTKTLEDSDKEGSHGKRYEYPDINGSMTLREVAEKYNISLEELTGAIKIPGEYADERLGRLRKKYQFDLNDLRTFVYGKIKNKQ
ncbi:MAG TPA: DUF4405 domain-containing protein [Bacteroidales bacterium]|nr:DUF4405 domain-containing protein [Bacteroidales bacterium]